MPQSIPYQPSLLRLLHGTIAVLTFLAIISGFWVYDTYDQRWGGLGLPRLEDIQGIHGTLALAFFLLLPFFALYSFHLGYRRLFPEQSFTQLKQVGQPIWWLYLQRLINTLILLLATFAALTGRMMKEEWLPAGEMDHWWYLAHLLAWLGVLITVALHLLLGVKVGGIPLLVSMFRWGIRQNDQPRFWLRGIITRPSSFVLMIVEIIVLGGIFLALVLPVFRG